MAIAISFTLMFAALIIGVPIAFAFGVAIIYVVVSMGYDPSFLMPTLYTKLNGVVLLAVPLFILSGGIIEQRKIHDALVDFIERFIARVKGSLAIIATIASAIFGSICGSGMATLSCIGSITAPKMREAKYPMHIVAAILATAAPLGLLIPPSTTQILFAWSGQVSVLACFLSSVVPGIILTVLISFVSWLMLRNNPEILTSQEVTKKITIKPQSENMRLLYFAWKALPALFLPVLVLGSIYGGLMTPTEAAGVAALYSIPVAIWVYKGIRLKNLKYVFNATGTSTGSIMMMLGFIMVLSRVLVMENVPEMIMNILFSISHNKIIILLMINVFLVIIGMIMDGASATLLCAPLLLPVITSLGVSPYQFAAILCVNLGMGNITPPCAPFLFFSAQLCDVDASKVLKPSLIIMLTCYLPTLLLTTFVPSVSLWLVNLVMG